MQARSVYRVERYLCGFISRLLLLVSFFTTEAKRNRGSTEDALFFARAKKEIIPLCYLYFS